MTDSIMQTIEKTAKRSRLATTSLILGIVSILTLGLLSLPCIICSHIARSKIKKGTVSGSRSATAGLVMGYLSLVILIAGAYWSSTRPNYVLHTLPSGKTIKLISIKKWREVGESDSLVLQYQTDINLKSKDELKKEVENIWQFLKVEVEKEGLTKARILAHSEAKGKFVKKRSGYGFVIVKQDGGRWKFLD